MAHHPSPLVFIDAAISNHPQVVAELGQTALVRVLPADQDGIAVITACVRHYPLTQHIVIVAHGAPGQIELGNRHLGLENCDRYAAQLQTWFASAQSTAQLDLYGCNVAAGDAGAEFLARLHQLTGAGIAASPRLVGHADLGGDWELNATVGEIVSSRLISPAFAASYRAVLAGTNNFADAQEWSLTNNTGTTVGATHQMGEPIHDPNVSGLPQATQQTLNNSIWWKWTATTTGPITVDTLGSALANTVLAVYTGGSVNSLNQIAFNDNISGSEKRSRVTFNAIAGLTYYFAVDGVGNTTGSVMLNLNTAPQIDPNQSFNVLENSPAGTPIGTLTANESGLVWSIVSGNPDNDSDGNRAFTINASTGAILVNDAGDLDFEAFAPTYSLVVKATDSGGLSSQQTITINLMDAPDTPVITNLTTSQSTITEGSQLRLSGTFNDPDAEDVHTVTINWGDGTVDIISNDNLSLPDADGNKSFTNLRHTYQDDGQYTITVTVEDAGGATTQSSTSVAVNNVPPTITQGATLALAVNEDSPTTFTLNATDPGRQDILTWSILNQPANGTASVSASPTGKTQTIFYTPTANFAGRDTFEVQVQDNDGGFDTILVNVTVAPQPDPPTSLSLSGHADALNEGETFILIGSFADPDLGDSFTVTINWGDDSPATVLPNSNITALGNGNYSFSTSHTYQADSGAGEFSISAIVRDGAGFTVSDTLSLSVANVPPSIEEGAFLALNTLEDEAVTFALNATDPADESFEWSIVSAPTNGSVSFVTPANGPAAQELVYTPNDDFDQLDGFTIQVSDGNGGFNTIDVLVNVTPVNDAPESLSLIPSVTTLSEGSSLTLDGAFVDVDSNDAHTVTIAWGDGSTTMLSAADLGAPSGNLYTLPSQTHIYVDEGNYTITLTVEDAEGATASITQAIAVSNVAPIITDAGGTPLGDTLTLPTGAEDTPITLSLGAIDPGLNDVLRWSVATNPTNGRVTLSPVVPGQPQQFVYTPNLNFFGVDSFTVRLTDGDGGVDTLVVNLSLDPVNDLPVVTTNRFTITEGQSLRITQANLNATDVETFNPNLRFTITDLAPGERFTVSGGIDNTFTLADVIQGRVTFIDNGDAIAPAFTISVQDENAPPGVTTVPANVTFIPVNDAPVIVNRTFDVVEGQITLLSTSQLSATDEESPAGTLVYTVTRITGGVMQVGGQTKTTFTQADIDGGRVAFVHDGSETEPTLTFTVSDGTLSTPSTAVINFTPVNDPPQLLNNTLTVTEGSTIAITLQHIDATDVDDDDNTLIFTVSDPIPGGEFQLRDLGTGLFAKTTEFSRLDIINNRVRFVHNGEEVAPSYTLTVRDDDGLTDSSVASVSFTPVNDAPTFVRNILTLSEGETLLLSTANILAIDEETIDPAELTYSISDLSGGWFEFVSSPGDEIDTFTQADIDNNRVRFIHDGDERAPAYTLTLSDGVNSVVSEADVIFTNVNDPPVLVNNKLAITEGQTRLITTSDIDGTDIEDNDNTLIFTVGQVVGGVFTPSADFAGGEFQLKNGSGVFVQTGTFTRGDVINQRVQFVHNGAEISPQYAIQVTDSDGESSFGTATVTFTPVNDLPVVVNNRLIVSEGGVFVFNENPLDRDLVGTDEETPHRLLRYTVAALTGGQFEDVARPGVAITTFTQQQVDDRTIRFVHNGGEAPPTYTLRIDDGKGGSVTSIGNVTFTNVNDSPIFTANSLTLTEGGTVVLTTANLNAVDVETQGTKLTFEILSVVGGRFEFINGDLIADAASGSVRTFTLEDVILERVRFVQPPADEETVPAYTVAVTDDDLFDPKTTVSTGVVNFTPINDPPTIVVNSLTIAEGGIALFGDGSTATAGILSASDPETPAAQLRYTVSNVVGGRFERVAAPGVAVTSFTQADIAAGTIRFVQNGTSTIPGYTVTVADAQGLTTQGTPTVNFTDVNEAPSITRNRLSITEGQTVILSSANLQYSDEESGPDALTYTFASGPVGGQFERVDNPGVAITSFTQADINAGAIQFVQDGTETAPAYTLIATDGGGVTDTTPKTATSVAEVSFTRVNDRPEITTNTLTIQEEGTVVLNSIVGSPNLVSTDEETPHGNLTYRVEAVTHGRFELVSNPGAAITSFTQAQVDAQQVQFVHNAASGEIAPTYRLTVTDGEGSRSTVSEGSITFTRINDAPVIQINRLAITESTTVTLSDDDLLATDEEDTAETLTYTVMGGVAGGKFVRASDPSQTAITTFTQADINAGAIQFVQDGTETIPAYTLQVTDSEGGTHSLAATVDFTTVNDSPSLQTNSLMIQEGATVVLGNGNLFASDEESLPTELTYTVQSVTNGRFERVASPGTAITSFTQAQISAGQVQFVHSGAEAAPTYSLIVTDGDGATATLPATIDFTNVNDAPVIQINRLAITESTTVTLSDDDLLATDAEDTAETLTYTVMGGVAGGKFVRASDPSQTAITTFTQADINARAIQFVQDGSETIPAYTLQVTDSEGGTHSLAATVNFTTVNDLPSLQTNSLTIQEGATVVLGNGNLFASDEESAATALTYTVQSVTNGRFERVASPGTAITSFTQAQISAGQVQFVHSGAEAAPTYSLIVTDGAGATATLPATIDFTNVNDAPTFLASSLRVTEAGTVVLSSANINATDPDNNPDSLLYAVANVSGGQFFRSGQPLLSTDTFTRLDIALGRITFVDNGDNTPPSFEFKATDPVGATTTVAATVQFVPVNDAPQLNVNTFSIVEGNDLVLTATNLSASDEETPSGQLLYLVSNVVGGTFFNIEGDEIFSFTQAQVNEGNQIVFRHNGSETPPSFTLEVVDPQGGTTGPVAAVINYTPVNDAPVFTRNALTIAEGQTVTLSTSHIQVSDVDTPLSQLTFTILALENGVFKVNGSALGVGNSFTRNQLMLGQVSFTASDSGLKPAYTLEVSDQHPATPQTATSAATITFTPVNDAPVLQVNAFTITEGQDLQLSSSNLLVTDEETTNPAQLTYTVSGVAGGSFFNIATGLSVITFTQQAINEGLIFFRHNGNETPAAFTVTVRDPNGGVSLPVPGNVTYISVNDRPTLATNNFPIQEGGILRISTAHLNTIDPDNLPSQLTYTVGAITGGVFGLDATGDGIPDMLGITNFTQQDILSGRIFFMHDGNEAPPSFTLAVADNDVSLPAVPANITFTNVNDPPSELELSLSASEINEGSSVTLTGTFADIDSTTHTVTIDWGDGTTTNLPTEEIINTGGGNFSLPPISKTYSDDDEFVITVTVNDSEASVEQEIILTVNDVPPIVPLSGSGPIQANQLYTLTIGTPVDPGDDRLLSYRINWGDGTTTVVTEPGDVSKVYKVFGNYTISVTATEDNGQIFDLGTQTANILYPITDFTGDGQTDLFWRFTPGVTNIIWALKPNGEFDSGLEVRPLDSAYKVQILADFNNDGISDIFWRDTSAGINGIWLMDGAAVVGSRVMPTVDSSWGIAGFADFNNDGNGDVLWRNVNSGENVIWTLADGQLQQGIVLPSLNTAFMVAAISDFNGDGYDDLLWRNPNTGQNQVWLMNGTADSGQRLNLTTADPFFTLVAVNDFNGDKVEDLLWRHSISGDNVLWVMGTQGAITTSVILPQLNPAFALRGATDLNGDDQTDLLWRHATTSETLAWAMNGTTVTGAINLPDPEASWQVYV